MRKELALALSLGLLAPALTPAAQAEAAPIVVPALAELTDAECVTLYNYLVTINRLGIRHNADQAAACRNEHDGAEKARSFDEDSRLLATLAGVPRSGLPKDFQDYLGAFYASAQVATRKLAAIHRKGGKDEWEDANEAMERHERNLKKAARKYPRAAAIFPQGNVLFLADEAQTATGVTAMNKFFHTGDGPDLMQKLGKHQAKLLRQKAEGLGSTTKATDARLGLTRFALSPFYQVIGSEEYALMIGDTETYIFPHDSRNGYSWQLAQPQPKKSLVTITWATQPAEDDEWGGAAPASRVATLRAKGSGSTVLRFVFTRPGDKAPLFTREFLFESGS